MDWSSSQARAWKSVFVALATLLAVLAPLPATTPIARAATLNVDINDAGCSDSLGSPYCSISAAMGAAGPGDMVSVAAGTYPERVFMGSGVTLEGAGAGVTIVDSTGIGGATLVGASNSVVRHLTVTGGTSSTGAGVSGGTPLTLDGVVVDGNHATIHGGGINLFGTLTLIDSVISNNTADAYGGGIYGNTTLHITMIRSRIVGNTALGNSGGGGLFSQGGSLVATDSSITGNTAPNSSAAAVRASHAVDLTNVTISGNTAAFGPAVNVATGSTLNNVTVTENTGGIGGGTIGLTNSIVAGNTGTECSSGLVTPKNNLIGVGGASCTGITDGVDGNLVGTPGAPIDPVLGPLQVIDESDAFGHPLLLGSPAYNGGDNATCALTDQAGFDRPQSLTCDMGALEAQHILQDAINDAAFEETINVPAGIFMEELFIDDWNVNLAGAGIGQTILDGNGEFRPLTNTFATVELSDLTIRNGAVFSDGGGIYHADGSLTLTAVEVTDNQGGLDSAGDGGGIAFFGYFGDVLTLDETVVSDNFSDVGGGGIAVFGGDVAIDSSTITGNGAYSQGGGLSIQADGTVTFTDVIVSDNESFGDAGGGIAMISGDLVMSGSNITSNSSQGGGAGMYVSSDASAAISDSVIQLNEAQGSAGGVYNQGLLTLTTVTVRDNTALEFGEGVYGQGGGLVLEAGATVTDSSILGNYSGDGGGIYVFSDAVLNLVSSTVAGNEALYGGGGVFNDGTVNVDTSTVSGNLAGGDGGGFYNWGTLDFLSSTVVLNASQSSGGAVANNGDVTSENSIFAGNSADSGQDCSGTATSNGYNLIGRTGECLTPLPTDLTGSPGNPLNPQLTPLQNNGGPTLTHAPLGTSPAIEAGSPACGPTDQRGIARPQDSLCDIGAVEAVAGSITVAISAAIDTTEPGASIVPTSAIPLDDVRAVASTPVGSVPVGSVPVGSVPVGSVPVGSVPVGSVPVGSVPVGSVPVGSVTLSSVPVGSVPLTCGPEASWEAILAGTALAGLPLQTVTLEDVLNLVPLPECVADLTLGNLDTSATVLSSISVAGLALGDTGIGNIPLTPGSFDAVNEWCSFLFIAGFDCVANGVGYSTSIAALDILGAPVGSVPVGSVPVGSVFLDLASTPVGSVPVGSVPVGSVNAVLDCDNYDCNSFTTFADAFNAGALRTTATLDDIFFLLLPPEGYPVEFLDLDRLHLQLYDPNSPIIPFAVEFDVDGAISGPATITIDLPDGFLYRQGTAVLTEVSEGEVQYAVADPTDITGSITFTTPNTIDSFAVYTLAFDVSPGLDLGTFSTTASVSVLGVNGSDTGASMTVIPAFEPESDDPSTAAVIASGNLVLSHIGGDSDTDYFALEVPAIPGGRVKVTLTQQDSDNDLAIYRPFSPELSAFNDRKAGVPASNPVEDQGVNGINGTNTLSPEVAQDVIVSSPVGSVPVGSVSANRDTANEEVEIVTSTAEAVGTETYTIQVTGFNGEQGLYLLSATTTDAAGYPICPSPLFPNADPGAPAPSIDLSTLPADVNTLIFTNGRRLERRYGAVERANVEADLANLVALLNDQSATPLDPELAALGIVAAVIDVESVIGHDVSGAYEAWDANPCNPDTANAVVTAITGITAELHGAGAPLRFIMIAGSDEMIPMERVPDLTELSNERDYAATFGVTTPLYGAFISENVLSDDPYADIDPIPWLGRKLFIPDLAIGRLIETPAEIRAALQLFIDNNGALNPGSSLVTGYDFLTDGANDVASALTTSLGSAPNTTLISETWDRSALITEFLPPSGPIVDVAAINAHYDHYRALPADDSDGLFDVVDLIANGSDGSGSRLENRIVFSMGCHFGLSVTDDLFAPGDVRAQDWAQVYAQHGAIIVGNTGFGYGDTVAAALSERLFTLFAERLDGSMAAGEALTYAKQEYVGGLGLYGVFDEKVLVEATFWGIPFYTLGGGGTLPPVPTPFTTIPDPTTGLEASTIAATGITFDTNTAGSSEFLTVSLFDLEDLNGAGGPESQTPPVRTQVTHYRPIQPLIQIDVTPDPSDGKAHGAVILELASIDDIGVDPAVSRPVIDLSGNEEPFSFADTIFPAVFHGITHFRTPDGERQRLVVIPGQFSLDDPATGLGTQRRYTDVTAQILYSTSDDFTPATIATTDAFVIGGTVDFAVTADAGPGDAVTRVIVMFKDDSGAWVRVELSGSGNGTWTGSAAGVVGDEIEYFVQVVDGNGNVAVSTNKARLYTARLVDVAVTPTDADEGDAVELDAQFTVPASITDPVALLVAWGDGTTTTVPAPTSPASLNHTYSNNGLFRVQACISTGLGFEQCDNAPVTIANVVPTVDAGGDVTQAATAVTIEATFTDPGADKHTVTVDWGDGTSSNPVVPKGNRAFNASHSYSGNGTYTVLVTVADGAGSGNDSLTVTIANSPPSADDDAFDIDENSPIGSTVGTVSASDPDAGDDLTFAITAGNAGGEFDIDGVTGEIVVDGALDHEAFDTYVLTVEVTDDGDPNLSGTAQITVTINDVNEAPSVQPDSFTVNDDATPGAAVGTVSASDPDDGDSVSFAIISGNTGSAFAIHPTTGAITVAGALDAATVDTYLLDVEVTDDGGLKDSATILINVLEGSIPPDITSLIVAPAVPIELLEGIGGVGTATVEWTGDASEVVFDWGDGTATTVTPASGDSSASESHAYSVAGVFTVTATVADGGGVVDSELYEFVVVFDPSSGYLTGSAKYESPAGTWMADPLAATEVKVGFNAKYKNGAVKGNVKVDFKDLDVEKFKADDLEWLVVSGDWAQTTGIGFFKNDPTPYRIRLTVSDGDIGGGDGIDRIRVKITLEASPNTVVYDSQPGDGDTVDPTTAITKGNVKVKSKKPI